jgi:multimeric flavodoxin WrbA
LVVNKESIKPRTKEKSMKILALCGSPKRGNNYAMLNFIGERFPNLDYKIIMLNEVNLEQCKGCYLCIDRGEELCPLKDDRDMILEEIDAADGVIMATPVHVNHVSALTKHFIGRIGFLGHRPRHFDKYLMPMAIAGGFGADEAAKHIDSIFSVFGFNVVPSLELYISAKEEREKQVHKDNTINAMNKFIEEIEKGQTRGHLPEPTLLRMIYFRIFKAVSEVNPTAVADYEYYKDKSDYYYSTKMNPIKKMLANRIAGKEIAKMVKDR